MGSKQPKPQQPTVKEDDEFQEFHLADWTADQEDHVDATLWSENWDDDSLEDDFSQQLRAEIIKHQKVAESKN